MDVAYSERGYLKEPYRIFYLSDIPQDEVAFHYHNFMKIFVLLAGNVSYIVEGKQYELNPYDIVLISAGEIHRPVVHGKSYKRIILYLSREFFEEYKEYGLEKCFSHTQINSSHVIRYRQEKMAFSPENFMELTNQKCHSLYAAELLQRARLVQFLCLLNHTVAHKDSTYVDPVNVNRSVLELLDYINKNIAEHLTVDVIAKEAHLNRSYLMHKFKAETGYTIGEYITEKRLFLAENYISEGYPATEACYRSGFQTYSSFFRAYKKKYGRSPKQYTDREKERQAEFME